MMMAGKERVKGVGMCVRILDLVVGEGGGDETEGVCVVRNRCEEVDVTEEKEIVERVC